MIDSKYFLIPVSDNLKDEIIRLLKENNLPTEDLDEHKKLFALVDDTGIIGTGGLELFEDSALLRSVSVKESARGWGYGKVIVSELESLCEEKNITGIYLLTDTAKEFFEKLGYEVLERSSVPSEIRETTEFSQLCPTSAIVMKKVLA
jgi:amino-acid N-acetyltransferase